MVSMKPGSLLVEAARPWAMKDGTQVVLKSGMQVSSRVAAGTATAEVHLTGNGDLRAADNCRGVPEFRPPHLTIGGSTS